MRRELRLLSARSDASPWIVLNPATNRPWNGVFSRFLVGISAGLEQMIGCYSGRSDTQIEGGSAVYHADRVMLFTWAQSHRGIRPSWMVVSVE